MAPPVADSTFIEEVTERVRHGLEERLQGRSPQEIGSPAQVAERMLGALPPKPSRWDELLGPFYSNSQMEKLLGGVSRQALADRRERRTLLGLKTADGVMVYPAFQFDEQNRVLPGLPEVLRSFRDSGVDDWTLAGWLVSPSRALDGCSVVEWLRQGRELETALTLARDAARRFSR
ncbi:MAG TPA: hypothetical protein VMW27_19145 [Thermoanaerobaculia bacterium]|nr:hypothetical protein [Thermoanaerobaculia bacterium]